MGAQRCFLRYDVAEVGDVVVVLVVSFQIEASLQPGIGDILVFW